MPKMNRFQISEPKKRIATYSKHDEVDAASWPPERKVKHPIAAHAAFI